MEFKKTLNFTTAFSMVVGSVLGSGIFMVSSDVMKSVMSPTLSLMVWVVAGLISATGCLIFCELGTVFPRSGGQYVYLYNTFGPLLAYLYGWTLVLVIQTGSIAAVAVVCAVFAQKTFGMTDADPRVLGSFIIAALTFLNILGLNKAAKFLDILTGLKSLALLAIPMVAIYYFKHTGAPSPLSGAASGEVSPFQFSGFGVALIAAFWAYDGWNSLAYIAGDILKPRRNIPLATMGGIIFVIIIYLLMNGAYQLVLSPSEIAHSSNVASDMLTRVLGSKGLPAVSAVVMIATLGTVNAFIIAGSRIIYSMASHGGLPPVLGQLSSKEVPTNAFYVQSLWALCLLWSGRYDQLYTCVICISFVFYGLTALALFKVRREGMSNSDDVFRTPLYPFLPLAYALFCAIFTINAIFEKPLESLMGVILMLLGIPVYYFMRPKAKMDIA